MPFEPLRFVHAANLCLDATLQCTIPLSREVQALVEDATLHAFGHLVSHCIEQRADFLLLTGNSFIERDRSLRARLALRDSFRVLDREGIPVFVTPGEHDPPEAWQAIPELPDNVTVCYPSNPEPVAVLREGRVITTIANTLFYGEADHFGIKTAPGGGDRRPFRIGMLYPSRLAELESRQLPEDADEAAPAETPSTDLERTLALFLRQSLVDYAVLAGQKVRRTIRLESGVAHCPGRPQPLAPADHSRPGATLVEVDAAGQAVTQRLPTVTTRWKSFEPDLQSLVEFHDIVGACRAALQAEPREPTEGVWLINWNLLAESPVSEDFSSPGYQERFSAALDLLRDDDEPRYAHSFRVFPAASQLRVDVDNQLAAHFSALTRDLKIDEELLQSVLPREAAELAWSDRLGALIPELDRDLIAANVRRLGTRWFANVGQAPAAEAVADTEADGAEIEEAESESA